MEHHVQRAAANGRRRTPTPTALVTVPFAWSLLAVVVGGYALVATALGSVDRLTGDVRTEWNPFDWDFTVLSDTLGSLFGGDLASVAARTSVVAIVITGVCLVVGVPVAEYVAHRSGRFRPILLALLVVPLLVGGTVRTVALTGVFGSGGVAERIGELVGIGTRDWLAGDLTTVTISMLYMALPLFVVIVSVAVARVDEGMLDVARDLGARRWSYLFGVVVPLARRGIIAGSCAAAAVVAGDFWTARMLSYNAIDRSPHPTEMIAGRVEALVVDGTAANDLRAAAALGVLLAAPLGVGAWLRLRSAHRARSAVA